MSTSTEIQKSISEQILDELIARLREQEEFDESVVDKLQRLAQNGELKKSQQIVSAIRVQPEQNV